MYLVGEIPIYLLRVHMLEKNRSSHACSYMVSKTNAHATISNVSKKTMKYHIYNNHHRREIILSLSLIYTYSFLESAWAPHMFQWEAVRLFRHEYEISL